MLPFLNVLWAFPRWMESLFCDVELITTSKAFYYGGGLSVRIISRADAWPWAGCSGMLPCCPTVDGTSLGSGPVLAERPVLIMEALERRSYPCPGGKSALCTAQILLLKGYWSPMECHLASLSVSLYIFTSAMHYSFILLAVWLLECQVYKKIPFGANGGAITSSRELPRYTLLFKNVGFCLWKK